MSAKQVWISPFGDDWKVHSANSHRAAAIVEDKSEAVSIGRQIAINNKAELIVQNRDGVIGYRNSFGNDPSKIPG